MSLLIGCEEALPRVSEGPGFCDVEQPRRFTQHVLDWRAANDAENLRLDWKTNTTWDRECIGDSNGDN